MNHRTLLRDVVLEDETLAHYKRVAIVRSLEGLGDFLCLVPALRSLRVALPEATITLIGLSKTQPLVQRFHHYIDELLAFPGFPGLPEQIPQLQRIPDFLETAQKQCFDLALQLHGSGIITNPLTMLLGAKQNAGFFLSGQYCPDPNRFLPFREDESEIRRTLRLMAYLGLPTQGEALEFPLHEADYQAAVSIEATYALQPGRYVCVHSGASIVDRRWSPKCFAIVADTLARQGLQIVLTGSAEEAPLNQAVARFMQAPSINLAGRTDLGALAVLLKGARLLVCNDTGVSHLAAALQVPSVVIFTTSNPDRWAPLDRTRHRVICTTRGGTLEDAIVEAEALLHQSSVSQEASLVASHLNQNREHLHDSSV
ncbi:MAG: glycosyltransferase family 9 protein [Leptolyngbya sp. BL-A-14]